MKNPAATWQLPPKTKWTCEKIDAPTAISALSATTAPSAAPDWAALSDRPALVRQCIEATTSFNAQMAQAFGAALPGVSSSRGSESKGFWHAHMRTMVLVDLPTFTRTKSPSFVGKYTSTMDHMDGMAWPPGLYNGLGWCLVLQILPSPPPPLPKSSSAARRAFSFTPPLLGENFNPHWGKALHKVLANIQTCTRHSPQLWCELGLFDMLIWTIDFCNYL